MEELLQTLESRIRHLLDKHESLQRSHSQLSQGQGSLQHENKTLMSKQEKAIKQIEDLVARLKSVGKMP